jgi:hypothetical protein
MKNPIETERLLLREVVFSDVDGMFELDLIRMFIFTSEINQLLPLNKAQHTSKICSSNTKILEPGAGLLFLKKPMNLLAGLA